LFKHVLTVALLTMPLCGYSQSYADSPFYKPSDPALPTAYVQGWQYGSIKANGTVIDLSIVLVEVCCTDTVRFEQLNAHEEDR
jgi:hypothetical protein